jgi:hypothetical protein
MRLTPVWLLALVLCSAARAEFAATDGPVGYRAFNAEMIGLVRGNRFDEVEARAARYRAAKERGADGWWMLAAFYAAVTGPSSKATPESFRNWFAASDRWIKAKPTSVTALVARARSLRNYAWQARGSGYSDKVSDESWKLFFERLKEARVTLDRARAVAGKATLCPGWYDAMMGVALGQQWERADYEKLFSEATAAHPDYEDYYLSKAYYLLPRWYGAPGEWQRFAVEARARHGVGLYARICWAQARYEGFPQLFRDHGIAWRDVQDGFEALHKRSPDSMWVLNHYARMAVGAGDRATALRLMREIGDNFYESAWTTRANYDRALAWTMGGATVNELPEVPLSILPKKK